MKRIYTLGDALKDKKEILELLSTDNSDNLNISQWEKDFIENIRQYKDLSDKQINMIKKISGKI